MASKSGRARRSVYLGFAVVLLLLGLRPATPSARQGQSQGPFFVSGRNVNTVGAAPAGGSGTDFIGDPLFKQQNEVDCDVSPNDSRLVFCANNDYRGIEAFGDSWIGVTMSDDGGLTWKSRLHPGFPAPGGQIGAADPVVATVPGLGLIGYITISRNDNRGTLSLGRWLERNKENGDRYTFLDNVVIGSGTPGRFADKPAMVVVLTPDGMGGGVTTVGDRAVPNGVIHFGYAIFPGNTNNSSSEIYHLMSADYGRTWSSPKKLSESVGINQGIDFAVAGDTVVATWRRIKDNNEPDAIMFARSTDGGKTWGKAAVLSLGTFFDQDSSDLQFRTRSMPSIVHDGTAFHVFWAARGLSASPLDTSKVDARVVVSTSAGGGQWSGPTVVDNHSGRGHQLMPTAAVAGGRVQVNWIDSRNNTRDDSFRATLSDYDYYDDRERDAEGNPRRFVYRQAVDVFAAQAPSATSLAFAEAQQVSRYRTTLIEVPGTPPTRFPAQVEYNFINARMFKQGAWPFHGDYHTVASRRYVPNPDPASATTVPWVANTAALDSNAVFYSAFTDNRDVRGYVWAGPPNTSFTPAGQTLQGESGSEVPAPCTGAPLTDPDAPMVWTPDNSPRSRDQNVYAAATLPGLLVESPSGSKPVGTLQRAYAVTVYNLTPEARTYRLSIATPPPGVLASWERCEPGTICAASAQLESRIDRRSSITRTVYLQSAQARPRIVVNVVEQATPGQSAQTGAVILNADPSAPQIDQPDGNLADILAQEIYEPGIGGRQTSVYTSGLSNPEVVPVPSVEAPRIEYPRIEYPRIEYDAVGNPRIEYPRIEYPRIEYDAVGNPRIEYPRIEYPRIEYKAIENPRIEYSALSGDVTEITWPVTTDGANTTTAMTAKVFVNGGLPPQTQAQILVTVPYTTGVANSCAPGNAASLVDSQVIVDTIVAPADLAATLDPPDVVNPPSWQPSFPVKPGQTVWVTLRIRGVQDANLAGHAGLWVRSQPDPVGDQGANESLDGQVDVEAPVLHLGDLSVLANVEGNAPGGANVSYTVTATDAVDGPVAVDCGAHPPSGSFFPLGSTGVTCSATDSSGHQASESFTVTVVDTTPPTFPAAGGALAPATEAIGPNGATVNYALPTATDIVDASPTVSCSPASGSTFGLGQHTVICTATDGSRNAASATFTVRVVDTRPPVLTALTNVTADSTSAAGAVVFYPAPAAIDLVDASPSVACTPVSGSTFPVGTTTVTCVARDAAGNVSTPSSFTVTVRDVTPPVIVEAATPTTLIWSPNKVKTPVTVSGTITDATTVTASYSVVDEYGTYSTTSGVSIPVNANGTYSFTVSLEAWRKGTDSDGRTYTITVTAVDVRGNMASTYVIVKVPHN